MNIGTKKTWASVAMTATLCIAAWVAPAAARAQTAASQPVLMVVEFEIIDPAAWSEYTSKVTKLPNFAKVWVRAAQPAGIQGDSPKRVSIFEHASLQAAQDYWNHPDLLALRPLADKGAKRRVYVVPLVTAKP